MDLIFGYPLRIIILYVFFAVILFISYVYLLGSGGNWPSCYRGYCRRYKYYSLDSPGGQFALVLPFLHAGFIKTRTTANHITVSLNHNHTTSRDLKP